MSVLDAIVAEIRAAAAGPDPEAAVLDWMAARVADPAALAAALPRPAVETHLHEDDAVSIWHERFEPDVELPPHDHAMTAILGVYEGAEVNRLWQVGRDGRARPGGTLVLEAGAVHRFDAATVHAVRAGGGRPCFGLHVYLGPLTRVERRLYDRGTGMASPLTAAAFDAAIRPV